MSRSTPRPARACGFLTLVLTLLVTASCSGGPGAASSSSVTAPSQAVEALLPEAEGNTSYPLTLASPYGESVIEQRPARVAAVGANAVDAELLLAMGVTPVTTNALGFNKAPWLQELAGDRIELVFETESWDQYPYEAIAAAKPDVIVAFGYDLTNSFEKLSAIAPVITSDQPWTGYFNNPWQHNIRILGKALDLTTAAEKVISDHDSRIASIVTEHPEFAGKSLSYTVWFGEQRGLSYQSLPGSTIAEVFASIGFSQAPAAGSFSETQTVSNEQLGLIDADVLVISGSQGAQGSTVPSAESIPGLTDSPIFASLGAWQQGHTVILEGSSPAGWAMSTAGPLGTRVALDILVPRISEVLS